MSRSSDSSHASAKFHRQYCGLAEAESVTIRDAELPLVRTLVSSRLSYPTCYSLCRTRPPPPTLTTIPGGFVVYEPQWDCCETGATNSWPNEQCLQQCVRYCDAPGWLCRNVPALRLATQQKESQRYLFAGHRNKDGGDVKACDTCPATLANIAQLLGLKILDMALPEFWWMYEEEIELVDGGGHLGFEEDTES
ncbi:hypothetical protein TWF132_001574 [Orbilia oligospora]|nr:hypothetical protein TWF132_001574 [Orbilia oligospora]